MIKFTCDMCMDLMPLVHDGVASPDSISAVEDHIIHCPHCRELYHGQRPGISDTGKMLKRIRQQAQIFWSMVMMFGLFFGLMLTAGNRIFYNAVIMPVIGAIGYYLFRWRGLYLIPLLLLITHCVTNALGLGNEYLDLLPLILWTGLYILFAMIGYAIALLLHFGMKMGKNVTWKKLLKLIALVAALVLLFFVCSFANSLVGNPVSRWLAEHAVEEYLEETYPGTDYSVESFGFTFKYSAYYAHIRSETSIDTQFTLYIDLLGKVYWDTYDSVTGGFVTGGRLMDEYRALTDQVFDSPFFPYGTDIGYGMLEIQSRQYIEESQSQDIPPWALVYEDLIVDQIYDIRELGAQAGKLIVYVYSEELSAEIVADILLTIRREFDQAGVPFRVIDLTVQPPRTGEGPWDDEYVGVENFPYEEIHEEGLVQRVSQAIDALKAYRAEQDAQQQKLLETAPSQ